MVDALTLDTNLLLECWKHQNKKHLTERLLELGKEGIVDLAVTARIREDIPSNPLASRIDELPDQGIMETGSVTRVGFWVLGRDMLGDHRFAAYYPVACELATARVGRKRVPTWKDWDHLEAHMHLKRDVFLTWDQGILCLAGELKELFGITVMKPDDYLGSTGDYPRLQ
jgi:hypothetical protein